MEYETIEAAAEEVGLEEWLCEYPECIWGEEEVALPSWDAPLTDEQFANVMATAEEEGW